MLMVRLMSVVGPHKHTYPLSMSWKRREVDATYCHMPAERESEKRCCVCAIVGSPRNILYLSVYERNAQLNVRLFMKLRAAHSRTGEVVLGALYLDPQTRHNHKPSDRRSTAFFFHRFLFSRIIHAYKPEANATLAVVRHDPHQQRERHRHKSTVALSMACVISPRDPPIAIHARTPDGTPLRKRAPRAQTCYRHDELVARHARASRGKLQLPLSRRHTPPPCGCHLPVSHAPADTPPKGRATRNGASAHLRAPLPWHKRHGDIHVLWWAALVRHQRLCAKRQGSPSTRWRLSNAMMPTSIHIHSLRAPLRTVAHPCAPLRTHGHP